jgi:hypothetical protein
MTAPRDQTIAAKILQNWSIKNIRDVLPVQLRPRSGNSIAPALIAALSELSNISKGQVDMIRTLLRDAVWRQCKKTRTLDQPSITVADVERSREWLETQNGSFS